MSGFYRQIGGNCVSKQSYIGGKNEIGISFKKQHPTKNHFFKMEQLTKWRIVLVRWVIHGRYFLTEMEKDFKRSSSSEVLSNMEKEVAQAIKKAIAVTMEGRKSSSFSRRGSML